jgi:Peptidase family S41
MNINLLRWLRSALIFGLGVTACAAQEPTQPLLKAGDLQADATVLRNAYESLHPGLYRYNNAAQMDAAFSALNQQLDHDETLQDSFLAFSEFAAKVRCGHTQANPFNQPKDLVEKLLKSATRVPFYFQWLNRSMMVTKDFTPNHSLPVGTKILKINGVPVEAILVKLMTIARADGANDSKRIAQLAVTGDSEYETFDIYFPMFFPQRGSGMDLLVRKPGSHDENSLLAKPLTFDERIAPIQERERQRRGGSDVLFEWKYLQGGRAYLKMPTWALYDSKWNWKQWLNEKIDEAAERNAPTLILDIRGDEGGNDVGNEILQHLVDEPLTLSPMRRLIRYRKVSEDLLPYLDTWDKSFRDWGSFASALSTPWPTAPKGVPYLKLTRYDDDSGDVIRPAGRRFHGEVVVLIDATNSSATFQFAQEIQTHHLGTLIGQPTGGSQRGINGGAFFFLRLPYSGIELDLPLIGTFPPAPMPDAGVKPDIPITKTAADIAEGRDPELAAALLVTKKN